ncbi:MAG: hypothetical protein AB1898_20415 [Acidobacteriota bacterium]
MRREFQFLKQRYELEMTGAGDPDGDFVKCPATVVCDAHRREGMFKLTKMAWEVVNHKAGETKRALDELLLEGCVRAVRAELYIRPVPEGFSYVVDHRFFQEET